MARRHSAVGVADVGMADAATCDFDDDLIVGRCEWKVVRGEVAAGSEEPIAASHEHTVAEARTGSGVAAHIPP